MKFYNRGKRRAQARKRKRRRTPVELTEPISPCDEKMKETAGEVAEEMATGLDQD